MTDCAGKKKLEYVHVIECVCDSREKVSISTCDENEKHRYRNY